MSAPAPPLPAPLALLAELTHRCPLRCAYCSNPTALTEGADELDTATWARVFQEAAALGCLQVHLSGGEPTARRDILDLVAAAARGGLYTNLITLYTGFEVEAQEGASVEGSNAAKANMATNLTTSGVAPTIKINQIGGVLFTVE